MSLGDRRHRPLSLLSRALWSRSFCAVCPNRRTSDTTPPQTFLPPSSRPRDKRKAIQQKKVLKLNPFLHLRSGWPPSFGQRRGPPSPSFFLPFRLKAACCGGSFPTN